MRNILLLTALLAAMTIPLSAQGDVKKGPSKAAIYSSLPSGYSRVGNTLLYQKTTTSSIDVIGQFGTKYYSSTFNDNGYKVAMKVGSNTATIINCANGTTSGGVTAKANIVQQGTMARIVYTFTNANATAVAISAGIHADVMIGNNDRAPLELRRTPAGNVYGITMKNGDGSQLCALFGGDMTGVTAADDYWFGVFAQNNSPDAMVGNYTQGQNWMEENGSYDSGMGWCWKNRTIPAKETLTLSWVICVGEVNLVPKATFTLKSIQTNNWNNYDQPHPFHVEGNYESPAGLSGYIEFMTDDSGEWQRCGAAISSGSNYSYDFNATFNEDALTHKLVIRTCDAVGNASELQTMTWPDIKQYELTGVTNKTYNGLAQTQTGLSCTAAAGEWTIDNYKNNVHAGEATFDLLGVYNKTMGHKQYAFTIEQAPLPYDVYMASDTYIYTGEEICPEIRFYFNGSYLVEGKDYLVTYSNNIEVGTGLVYIVGMGDFYGMGYVEFHIMRDPDSLPGDANRDGEVNILDPQWTLRYILAPAETSPFSFKNANTYGEDQIINVQDIVCTVNIMMSQSLSAAKSMAAGRRQTGRQPVGKATGTAAVDGGQGDGEDSLSDGEDGLGNGGDVAMVRAAGTEVMVVAGELPVAAIDMEIEGVRPDEVSLALPRVDFQMITRATVTGTRVVILSLTGRNILEAGETQTLLITSSTARPVAAMAASPMAEEVKVCIYGTTDGIDVVNSEQRKDNNGDAVFNLAGQRLAQPQRGVNIVGGRKVIIK